MRISISIKRTVLFLSFLFLVVTTIVAQQKIPQKNVSQISKPKLVVLIIADQFKADYLFRFNHLFGNNGFKRLISRGAYFTNANYPYANTRTATGHSTIVSGSIPAIHGVIGNGWYDRETGGLIYSATDKKVRGVGSDRATSSPSLLLTTTLGDQLRISNNYQSKSIGISHKDRSATFIAGRSGNAAYWFDNKNGAMVSSTYFINSLPDWVVNFNNQRLADQYFRKIWDRKLPDSAYNISDSDDAPYERAMEGEKTVFPHVIDGNESEIGAAYYHQFTATPFANEFLLRFAISALKEEKLGQDEFPDLLAVSFSSTDLVGHNYGPYSQEMEDMVIRFDDVLAIFLDAIDQQLGLDNVLIAFTSDHGVAPIPDYSQAHNQGGIRILGAELISNVEKALQSRYGEGEYISSLVNNQFYLNEKTIREKKLNQAEVEDFVGQVAIKTKGIATFFTRSRILSGEVSNTVIGLKIMAGFHQKRSGDVWLLPEPLTLIAHGPDEIFGTDHGTPYVYDTHVPIIIAGYGIKPGIYQMPASPSDITPTLCSIVGIAAPSGSVGRVLNEAIK
jgi:predicted AlkP superfamily pyrophosphatase or phosphodiesterase